MGNDLKLRRWCESDCRMLYDWRIAPETMRWCFDQRIFPYEDHERWFAGFLKNSQRFGFMLEDDGQPVAQIRLDPAELAGCYRISLAVAPGRSGHGYGSSILHLACQNNDVRRNAALLVAETMLDNLPSQKIFVRNGFVQAGSGESAGFKMLCWLLPVHSCPQPLPIQFFAEPAWLEDIESTLSATGLALFGDATAQVKLFMGAAVSDSDLVSSVVLHLNINKITVLDLALRYPGEIELPVEFYNMQTAVAQIAASLSWLQNH